MLSLPVAVELEERLLSLKRGGKRMPWLAFVV
jgi:hypothetical protein